MTGIIPIFRTLAIARALLERHSSVANYLPFFLEVGILRPLGIGILRCASWSPFLDRSERTCAEYYEDPVIKRFVASAALIRCLPAKFGPSLPMRLYKAASIRLLPRPSQHGADFIYLALKWNCSPSR
jgi:hypothetical protein